MNRQILFSLVGTILLIAGFVLACSPAPVQPVSAPVTMKIALLPIIENLPLYVAQQQKLFEKQSIAVEFIPVASAAERDQVFAAGQADGMINEIVATLLYNKEQIQIQIVRFARVATPTSAQFHILVAGNSGINSPQELKGVDIGISQGTIIEYITDRLLQAEGLSGEEIKTLAVPKMPDRLALLGSGELKAATLPDPLSFLGVQQGARILLDDARYPHFGHSTYAFRKSFIDQNPQTMQGFLLALEEAVQMINADPEKWENLLGEYNLVPAPLIGSYQIPPLPTGSVPDQQLWEDVLAWAKMKDLVGQDISYDQSVTKKYLP